MHITLIGMSNIGKSYWSRRLAAESGFERVACDMLIEQKLGPELKKYGYSGIRDVAKWMGQPFDPQYPETSAKYIAGERAVMHEILENLNNAAPRKFSVIDTTGSVIYAGDDITTQLRALTRIVYFEASPVHMSQLFDRYMNNPKPVIWDNAYVPRTGEPPLDALKRCYAELLQSRAQRYRDLAHITVPYEKHRSTGANIMSMIGAN